MEGVRLGWCYVGGRGESGGTDTIWPAPTTPNRFTSAGSWRWGEVLRERRDMFGGRVERLLLARRGEAIVNVSRKYSIGQRVEDLARNG